MVNFTAIAQFFNTSCTVCTIGGLVLKKDTNDHRIRVTKMLIRRAFTELLAQKPIQSISIKELCERAGINRGTFYSHYEDIYGLRSQIEEEMFGEFTQALEKLLDTGGELTPIRVTAGFFQLLKDNSDLCAVTLGEYGDKAFLVRLLSMARDKSMENYSKYFRKASPKKLEYFYTFVSAGCIGVLQHWLETGMSSSAEEIATITEGIMLQGIKFLQ